MLANNFFRAIFREALFLVFTAGLKKFTTDQAEIWCVCLGPQYLPSVQISALHINWNASYWMSKKWPKITIFCNLQKIVWTDLDPTRLILFFLKLRIFLHYTFFVRFFGFLLDTKNLFWPFWQFFWGAFRKFSSVQFCFNRFLLSKTTQ